MNETLAVMGGVSLVSGLCLWGNLRELRRKRVVSDTPTSKVLGVFIGMVELKGTAEAAQPLASYLTASACVHYSWRVEESWSRTVTETYTDSQGKTQTRTKRESGWSTVGEGGETIPFYLKDDTGVVLVRPEGAKLETDTFFSETVGRDEAIYYAKGPAESIPYSDHRRRFTEEGLPLHALLYVIGPARERDDLVAPEIAAEKDAPMFLISTRSEEKVQSAMGGWAWFWGILGLLITAVPLILLLVDKDRQLMDQTTLLAFIPPVLFLAVWAVGWVWMVYNSLVGLRQRVLQGWSLIDVQLKRRRDLIPRITAVVTSLASHEQVVQTALAGLRNQLTATAPDAIGPNHAGLAPTIRRVVEKYPQLKAREGFTALQKELVETEQRIALARAYYNDIATEFATRLEVVPDRWVANLRQMQPEPLLNAADFERAAVNVDFA